MAFISETLQMRRLTESGVNIKTTYIVDGTLRYRSTDGTCQDDVHSGIRCRKEYFRQGKLLHTEKIFDSRMEYTYVSGMDEEAQHTCENCGFTGKVKEFVNGCPCCDAASNIDYADKELGRNFDEIKRVLVGLQTVDRFNVALPADWHPGDEAIVPTASSSAAAEERMTRPDEGTQCYDWFFCTRPLPQEELEEVPVQ